MTRILVPAARRRVTPARAIRPARVGWTVSVALHIALLGFASVSPWLKRWPAAMTPPASGHRKLEQIQLLALVTPAGPATRRGVSGKGVARPTHTRTARPSDGVGIARDSEMGEHPAPIQPPGSEPAPLVNAPSDRRPWLTAPHTGDSGIPGPLVPLNQSVRTAVAAAADSLALAKEQVRKAMDWTVKGVGGFRFGISPMRVHLGLFTVPVPVKVVSMRDFDQQLAERRRIEAATREQFTRAVRDSIVSARIRAIRERLSQSGRVPQ